MELFIAKIETFLKTTLKESYSIYLANIILVVNVVSGTIFSWNSQKQYPIQCLVPMLTLMRISKILPPKKIDFK